MVANGNGESSRCAANILATVRGEVPFERLKGISLLHLDAPSDEAAGLIETDTAWALKTYEPRAKIGDVYASAIDAMFGEFDIEAHIGVQDYDTGERR